MPIITMPRPTFWKAIELTQGTYPGVWNGYEIVFKMADGVEYKFRTEQGIRGWADVEVTITPSSVSYEVVKK